MMNVQRVPVCVDDVVTRIVVVMRSVRPWAQVHRVERRDDYRLVDGWSVVTLNHKHSVRIDLNIVCLHGQYVPELDRPIHRTQRQLACELRVGHVCDSLCFLVRSKSKPLVNLRRWIKAFPYDHRAVLAADIFVPVIKSNLSEKVSTSQASVGRMCAYMVLMNWW